jgi:SAM-dependent methyltransferase
VSWSHSNTTFADNYSIAAVQPQWVPPNCSFEIDDVESDWLYRLNHFDFIHAREFLLAIRDWDKLIQQAFDHLKPGGYLELSCSVPDPGSDDGTVPQNSAWKEFTNVFFQIGEKIGASGHAPKEWKSKLLSKGFEDVHEHVFKIPSSPWPRDRRLKHIGALEVANLDKGAEALLIRGMTGVLGRSKEEATVCRCAIGQSP